MGCRASLPFGVPLVVLVAPFGWVAGVQAGYGGGWRWPDRRALYAEQFEQMHADRDEFGVSEAYSS